MTRIPTLAILFLALAVFAAGCRKQPPVTPAPAPAPPADMSEPPPATAAPPAPAALPAAPAIADAGAITSSPLEAWDAQPLDVINGPDSPLRPAFFAYDSDELDQAAQEALAADAELLAQYPTWVVTIEGHCDERGSAEYNLALGDRRALAAKTYLVSLGVSPTRIRTVSYGSEFPFDPAHHESAWAQNRRAHLMLTSK